MPPNGALRMNSQWRLTHTVPAINLSARALASTTLPPQTDAPRPNGVPLARSTASSSVL